MCGRFTLTATPEALDQLLPLFAGLDWAPQYNVAPSQTVLAARLHPETGRPEAVPLRWGLVPGWADDPKIGYKLINARLETAATKPAFRAAFKQRHCLVLADGFFEWRQQGKHKQPYWFRLRDGRPFAFAGLWETWHRDGQAVESCTILTTTANDLVRPVHDRMPVILDPARLADWLDVRRSAAPDFLGPLPAERMTATPVSTHVNSPRHNDPACVAPAPAAGTLF